MKYTPQAWRSFIEELGAVSHNGHARPYILESWLRCRTAEVDPAPDRLLLRRASDLDLSTRLRANEHLIEAAATILTSVSGSLAQLPHVLYLTDADGIVLWSTGNNDIMRAYGLLPGFDWSEATMGTNGAGTALAVNRPVAVIGPDHYSLPFHDATCLAAPLHNSGGDVIGAIDLSTHVEDAEPNQLSAVIEAAVDIERMLQARVHADQRKPGPEGVRVTPLQRRQPGYYS
jgi:transcriptional regulator of acetoin/glycerol metabolism